MKVLILGGYGTFGSRLARLLAADTRLTLVIAGRSLAKAQALCAALPPGAGREAAVIDRDGDLAAAFAAHAPDVVVDASGPFQAYAGHRVARAALAAGAHYIDLADDLAFVQGITALDAAAKDARRFALSGASTFPALSGAVVRELVKGMDWPHSILGGVSPSPRAGVGLSVVRAMAAQAGRPVAMRLNGQSRTVPALTRTLRYTVAPPGRLPLANRLFSAVEVPDLALLPPLWPQIRTVWIGAGPVPEFLLRALNLLAKAVSLKLLASLTPLAPLMHWATQTFRWGEARGGMFLHVTGYVRHRPAERSWHLIAEGDDGPFIPAMAAAALVRRCLDRKVPPPGARPCLTDLDLADFEAQFAGLAITTGRREMLETHGSLPLYRRVLGEAYDRLAPSIQALHDVTKLSLATGRGEVVRGKSPLAWLAGLIMGFPKAGTDVPVRVAFLPDAGTETWRREFDGRRFASVQSEGKDRWQGLVVERFGPLAIGMALVAADGRLTLVIRRWTLLGVALPLWLGPRAKAFEEERDGRFRFDVRMSHPLTGLIVHYRGWLEPQAVVR